MEPFRLEWPATPILPQIEPADRFRWAGEGLGRTRARGKVAPARLTWSLAPHSPAEGFAAEEAA